jgi:hypothetical protein
VKEAQYEVLGNDAKNRSVPPGTIETFGSWSRGDFSSTSDIYLPPGRAPLKVGNPALLTGYFLRVPCGTDFLEPPTVAIRDRDLSC